MNVVKHIICELTGYRPGTVDVSQGDRGSRAVSCRLMENGASWMIPEGSTARVAYTLPDGTEGLYDRRPDGTPMWEISKNIVTVELADQLMAQAGMVQTSILILGPEGGQLATWPIRVMVSANKAARLTVPEAMPPYGAGFAGKIFFGGEDGTVTPLGIGEGVEVVRQEDGTSVLVADGGSGGGAGNWDELKGKPVYMQGEQEKFDPAWLPDGGFGWTETGEATVEWDGNTEGLDVVAVGSDTTLVRVSGLLPSLEAMIGRTVEMADGSSYEVSAETAAQSGPLWVVYSPVSDDFLPVLYGVGATAFNGVTFPATGMYAVQHQDQSHRFARVAIAYETIHGLDPKYLPEEAVREYMIELDYSKTVVTSGGKYAIVGEIPNDLTYTEIRDAYASGQRLVVRLKNTDYPETYLRLVNAGDREWRFEADVGSQYTADRIQKLYLTIINQDISSDTVTARVAYINIELGGDTEQVQSAWSQNDPTRPDYVKDRTHWEESNQTVIEWDGNTEGREMVADGAHYHVSNEIPTVECFINGVATVTMADGSTQEMPITEDAIAVAENGISWMGVCVAYVDGAVVSGMTFPKAGTYFLHQDGMGYVSKFTYGSTVVHQLDEKWIPDSIAWKTDIPELDDTLTQRGKAADAAAVGAAIQKISGKNLPDVTADDAGKFLRVSDDGAWAAEALTNVAEVGA